MRGAVDRVESPQCELAQEALTPNKGEFYG
jgi:hypothetical protein